MNNAIVMFQKQLCNNNYTHIALVIKSAQNTNHQNVS